MFNVLVVEDDAKLRQLFCTILGKNKYHALGAENGNAALAILESEYIDLVISDIMMPQMNGFELTKKIREHYQNMPVLMITADETFEAKERGFLIGTDDYMVKPVNVNEMLLRVSALLRRAKIASEHKISCSHTVLDYDSLTLEINGIKTILPQKEFYLLYKLVSYPDRIFTRRQLMDEIWGMSSESEERTVDVHINRLRERVNECEDFEIITVRGLGYKVVKHS